MPSTRKQINIRPHPDDYELIARIATYWGVTKTQAVERLALSAAASIAPALQQNGSASNLLKSASNSALAEATPLLNLS